jgi:thymidylate synthase
MNDTQYEDLLELVMRCGVLKDDRTGTGTRSVFGHQLRYDLRDGFPLITTKYVRMRSITYELLWFLSGDSNIKYLADKGVHIWDAWADDEGELGPIYGVQWRSWSTPDNEHVDQLSGVLETLRTDQNSRRMIVSSWNVSDLDKMALAPCHVLFQFYVSYGQLSCQVYQRSADLFLGVPFNIASYALLTHMIAQQVGLSVGELIWSGGDCHIYNNHVDQVEEQLSRQPLRFPKLGLTKASSLFGYQYSDVRIDGYQHYDAIKAFIAV